MTLTQLKTVLANNTLIFYSIECKDMDTLKTENYIDYNIAISMNRFGNENQSKHFKAKCTQFNVGNGHSRLATEEEVNTLKQYKNEIAKITQFNIVDTKSFDFNLH